MRLLSPRELADALGVSESSLKRWVDAGKITAARTEGGHRRIALQEAVRFIRESGAPLARPELLDMPDISAVRMGDDAFRHYLVEGDAVAARGWLLARYLGGASVGTLCDGPVREAMLRIGELRQNEGDGVFIEHRAIDTCLLALAQLRSMFEPLASAPYGLVAMPEANHEIIPAFMAATVVASAGMRSINLGPDTPIGALAGAFTRYRPALVWIGASVEHSHALERWLLGLPATTVAIVGTKTMVELAELATQILLQNAP